MTVDENSFLGSKLKDQSKSKLIANLLEALAIVIIGVVLVINADGIMDTVVGCVAVVDGLWLSSMVISALRGKGNKNENEFRL